MLVHQNIAVYEFSTIRTLMFQNLGYNNNASISEHSGLWIQHYKDTNVSESSL